MYDKEDRRTGERGASLLSLGRAIEDERAKQRGVEAPRGPAHPDAAARHQDARVRRESRATSPILDQLTTNAPARPRAAAASAPNPSRAAPRPASPVSSHVVAADHGSMSDTMFVMDRTDEEGWRPLIDPARVIGGIADSKGLIIATTLIGALLGAGLAIMTPKTYQAYAEVLVDPRNLKLVDRDLTDVAGLPSDATLAIIENQVRVLTSSTVLNRVIDKLGLESDPEFNGSGSGIDLNPLNLVRSLLTRSDATADPARRRGLTVQTLAENIHVERTGKTFTMLIGATAQDPKKAALIANTMVSEFVETADKRQADTAGRATGELTDRLGEMQRNVETAERKVEQFKAENDIIDAQGRLITDDEIIKLNDQLSVAKARTLELNVRAQSARSLRPDDVLNGASPEAAASGVLTELRAQYATAKQETERLSVRFGPRHPQYQAAQAQLDGAREQIGVELRRINEQVQTELRRAVKLEQELAARLAQLKVRQGDLSNEMVTLRELEREASTQRSVYEAYLLRARETGEQKDLNTENISIISEAQPPLEASGASRAMITGAGGFLGLLAGLGLGGARGALESLRDTSRSRRRRTATVRKPSRAEPDIVAAREPAPNPQPKPAPIMTKPAASVAPPAEAKIAAPSARTQTPAEENSMNTPYMMPGYMPQHAPANGYPAAPQAAYGAPPQPHPAMPQFYPQQPVYPQQQAHAPGGYVPQQPEYPAHAYPQAQPYPQPPQQGWPQPPQAHYPQPMMPQQQPMMPQQQAMPAQMPPYAPYPAQAYSPPYPQPSGYQPAPAYPQQPMAPAAHFTPADSDDHAVSGSLSEIKESIREFRDAVRELSETRSRRRYF